MKTSAARPKSAGKNLVEVITPMPSDDSKAVAAAALAKVKAFTIGSDETYRAAATLLMEVKAQFKKIDGDREALKAPSLEGCRRVDAFFRDVLDLLRQAEGLIKGKISIYARAQEQLRQEEQRRANEAAQRERDRLAEQARRAESSGKLEKAVALEQRSNQVVAEVIDRAPPKVAGLRLGSTWKFEIVDPTKINAAFLMPDEQKIRKQVAALKGEAAAIIGPGVRVWEDTGVAAGSGS